MISGYFNRNCIHFWQRFDLVWMEQHFEQHYPVNWRLHFNSLDFNSITLWFHSSNSICEQFSYYFEFLYSFQSKMDLIFFLDWSVENFIIDFGTAMSKSPFNLRQTHTHTHTLSPDFPSNWIYFSTNESKKVTSSHKPLLKRTPRFASLFHHFHGHFNSIDEYITATF